MTAPDCILKFPAVKARIGFSRMHIGRLEKEGKFPKRLKLGDNSVGWLASEIDAWLAEKAAARSADSTKYEAVEP